MRKPFVFGVAVGNDHFIGRKEEIERLSANFKYGVNTILISPRRIGKTSLVNYVANDVQDDELHVVKMDIFSCRSEYDFYNMFAAAVLQQTSSRIDEWRQMAQEFLTRITPRFSFSPEPMQEYSVSLGITPKTHTPEQILNLPEEIAKRKGWHIVVCIDEFQQIGDFTDTLTVQKRLRTVWQHQQNVSYCLYGSKRNMLSSLFQQRSKPFYKFGSMMQLGVIPTEDWQPYLCSRFANEGKTLSEDMAAEICGMVENHSSYVQQLAFYTLLATNGTTTMADINQAYNDLLDENTSLFLEKTEHLTTYQLNFMRAIIDDIHKDFGTVKVRDEYNLGSPSNIPRIRTALLERELIEEFESGLYIADPVLKVWLRRRFKWA